MTNYSRDWVDYGCPCVWTYDTECRTGSQADQKARHRTADDPVIGDTSFQPLNRGASPNADSGDDYPGSVMT